MATIAKVTQAPPDIDTDGFPLFLRLPGGRDIPITARSLPRLVAGLTTGVLAAHSHAVVANVIFVDRQPVDGMALREGRRVSGPDALDEIADWERPPIASVPEYLFSRQLRRLPD